MSSKKSRILKASLRIWSRLKSYLRQRMENTIAFFKTSSEDSIDLKSNPIDECWKSLDKRLRFANAIALAILVLTFLFACSPTRTISNAANTVAEISASSKNRFTLIHEEAQAPTPNISIISSNAVEGEEEQREIIELTQKIHTNLTGVEDKVPEWIYLFQYVAIALAILGVGWILWYTGLGTLIKRLIGFVPKAKRREATLARSVLDSGSPATVREYVAARRASDPEFDKAYERAGTSKH